MLIEDHDLQRDADASVPTPQFALPRKGCRSYLTRGLASAGQREIMFVLARHGEDAEAGFEREVLGLLQLFYKLACDGRTVDVGDMSTFGEPGPFGLSEGCGFAYLDPIEGPGPAVPEDALLALLLRPEERAAANIGGVYRAAAWIARAYRLWPYPNFSDPSRPSAVPPGLPETALTRLPLVRAPRGAGVFLQDKTLILRLEAPVFDQLAAAFAQTEQDPCFVIVTGHVPHATGRWVWLPQGNAPEAIGPSYSSLSTIEGGFVVLVGARPVNEASVVEDGFAARLRPDAWSALREAIQSRKDVEIEMAGNEDRFVRRFRIELKTDAISASAAERAVVDLKGIRLYLPEEIGRQRLGDTPVLMDYVLALHKQAVSFWEKAGQPKAKGILAAVGVRPDKQARAWCEAVDGDIPRDLLGELEQKLAEVPPPAVRQGPIAFAMGLGLWGQQPDNFPEAPRAWMEASDKPLTVPDELFEVIWP